MDSTNSAPSNIDKKKILEICTKIYKAGECREIVSEPSGKAESYYDDRADLKHFDCEIYEYDFATPAELRNLLEKMWEYQDCNYMKEFAVVAIIAAFHSKNENTERDKTEIPAFIYNF